MDFLIVLLVFGVAVILLLHPKTKNRQPMKSIRSIYGEIWGEVRSKKAPEPQTAVVEKTVSAKANVPGNIPRIKSETGKEAPSADRHTFPDTPEPVTRFEDFNRLLFLFKESSNRRWDPTLIKDYPTKISGEVEWLESEVESKLRTVRPVLIDPFGIWAEASSNLELDCDYQSPVTDAYLQISIERRPIVISYEVKEDKNRDKSKPPLFFICRRYGFDDHYFNRKFADDYPADILVGLMLALTASEEEWEVFSPARLRKSVLEKNREEEEYRHAMASYQHANRFAALWNLREHINDADTAERAS